MGIDFSSKRNKVKIFPLFILAICANCYNVMVYKEEDFRKAHGMNVLCKFQISNKIPCLKVQVRYWYK